MSTNRGLLWDSGHDESVEVNQRALIDKVLARYSGEFTVFRELLQNSDDAQSKAVEVRFETQKHMDTKGQLMGVNLNGESEQELPDLKTALVHQWTFKNNGIVFRNEDWSRLKKIAEGNPDEEKIGAFGVGFYSLFSVTDEPFVTSGGQWMGFYWKDKKDQLYARRGKLPEGDNTVSSNWTTFEMPLREDTPIPAAFDFIRFLASSITFMVHLSEVSVYFDDKRLARLTKFSGIPMELGMPRVLNSRTRQGSMSINAIRSTPLHIKAEVLRWVYSSGTEKSKPTALLRPIKPATGSFFSSLFSSLSGTGTPQRTPTPLPVVPVHGLDLLVISETNVSLSIFSAEVEVTLGTKIAAELQRSTKKQPPKRLRYELIYTAKDEYDASKMEDEKQPFATGSIFQGLRADLDGIGAARVFIGHSTGQTTGLGGHMASRFIPTVERESIDLVDRHVAMWNKDLLFIGGILARAAYELELANIKALWDAAARPNGGNDELHKWLSSRALHALKFFTFHQSTPSADVSTNLEDAFFSCAPKNYFSIISTSGIRNASDVRLPDHTFAAFLKDLPVLSEDVLNNAQAMVTSLQHRGMIKAITFEDVLKELRSRPLRENEIIACLKWWINVYMTGDTERLQPIRGQLLAAAVLTIDSTTTDEIILPLDSVNTFINAKGIGGNIPRDGPLPADLLPYSVSQKFTPEQLNASFPWSELSVVAWLTHICNPTVAAINAEFNINLSPSWAERVLNLLSRAWPSLPASSKHEIATLLHEKSCIPTSNGMKTPRQSYFPNADIFRDLPVVVLPSGSVIKGNIERVLQAMGVRRHVELQIIFDRMIKTNEWTVGDLTKYLASVQTTLTREEWERLKVTAAFSQEVRASDHKPGQKLPRYRANQLYEPLDVFRQLRLPVIDWGTKTKWRGSSEEGKFLFELGLLRFPPLPVLIGLCASDNEEISGSALKYLLTNCGSFYKDYRPNDFSHVAFVPALKGTVSCLGKPQEVFSDPQWSTLGFLVLHPSAPTDAATKLKLVQHPPSSQLVSLLEKTPPKIFSEATTWFCVLAGRIHDFSENEVKKLAQLSFVPTGAKTVKDETAIPMSWLPPSQCYFGGDSKDQFHSKLFVFVDFGPRANTFLGACGTKREPSVEEIAQILLADPHKFYGLAGSPISFLGELRNIAVNRQSITSGTLLRMKRSAILLGSRRNPHNPEKKSADLEDFEEDDWDLQYDLKRPDDIIIADDTHAHRDFGDSFFTAPQEDILEGFYADLGCRRLSSLVKEEYHPSSELRDTKLSAEIRSLVLERLPLFLHEHTHARTIVSYNWLSSGNNFVVKTFGKVSVTKSLTFGDLCLSRKQEASAVAQRASRSGPVQLWLANNAQVDMYEVATSLNRLLFQSPKTNDGLLFMTILSTDLRALKRRGYNVDRILRQQKAERQAVEDARVKARTDVETHNVPLISKPAAHADPAPPLVPPPPLIPEKPKAITSAPETALPPAGGQAKRLLQNLKRGLGSTAAPLLNTGSSSHTLGNPVPGAPSIPPKTGAQRAINSTVTPLSNIESNIDMALQGCRPESSHLLKNKEEMRQVMETLNEGYCDVSGREGDLKYTGEMEGIKIYLSQEVGSANFIPAKREALERFISVIKPLAQAYKLPVVSMHIFFDSQGGLIAFNRGGSIFLNLRYFEEWHDAAVTGGDRSSAYTSWYFTLAHEIAHNLVHPHNSEHEFYFSAICQRHIVELQKLIMPGSNGM